MDRIPRKQSNKPLSRWDKLRLKYQFNIMNEENYEVRSVFSLSILNLVVWSFMVVLAIAGIAFASIAFTPLKQYIPGYGKADERRMAVEHQAMADSIALWAGMVERKMQIIERVLSGDIDTAVVAEDLFVQDYDSLEIFSNSKEDSLLRAEVEQRERFSIFDEDDERALTIGEMAFYPPVKGLVSDSFDEVAGHYGLDIVPTQTNDVKAVQGGRVVLAEYTIETGYVIALQHEANLLSVYKHNSLLTRKLGDRVRQGEVIAVSGNTGERSSGPHLHFEIWYKGEPLDPADYINLE